MPSNAQRREAYQFYRSLGYSSKEAANLRNKSPTTLSDQYRTAARDARKARDDFDGETAPPPKKDIYRPDLDVDNPDFYAQIYDRVGVPDRFTDQIFDNPDVDLIDLEVYADRFSGLASFFNAQAETSDYGSWEDILEMLEGIDDLGDFLDALGELYDQSQ
jgi:hypothetical protein